MNTVLKIQRPIRCSSIQTVYQTISERNIEKDNILGIFQEGGSYLILYYAPVIIQDNEKEKV